MTLVAVKSLPVEHGIHNTCIDKSKHEQTT